VPEAEIVRAAEIGVATVVDAVVVLAAAAVVGAGADAVDALGVVEAAAGVDVPAVAEAGTRPLATDIHGSHGSSNRDRTRVRSLLFSVKSSS
jgi:hypothetical protein